MKKLLLAVIALAALEVSAQNDSLNYRTVYGAATPYEMTEEFCPFDRDAEAAVIYEIGEYRYVRYEDAMFRGFRLEMTVTTKIKIYKDAGLDFAKFEIPYYDPSHDAEIVKIEGNTYNIEDGRIVCTPLSKANIFTEKGPGKWMNKRIAFPGVRAGSVIELKYTIETPYYFNMRTWRFQKKIPVMHSRLVYKAIPFYEYSFIAKGLTEFDEQNEEDLTTQLQFSRYNYREREYTFVMNDLPAFRDEEFLYNTDDYMCNINFQLARYFSFSSEKMTDIVTTWPKMCIDLLQEQSFGKFMEAAEKEGKKILHALALGGKSELEKFRAVTEYVKSEYAWDKYTDKYSNKKITELLKEKTGNTAALNLMLTGLLRAAGLDAHPVILSTRPNGLIYVDFPYQHLIDNVVAMVRIDGTKYFADASVVLSRYDEVSWKCNYVSGIVVDKKNPEWVVIEDETTPSEISVYTASISPEKGIMSVEMRRAAQGYAAYSLRTAYNGDIEKLRDKYKDKAGMTVKGISVENFHETDKPFVVNMQYDLSIARQGEEAPAKLYFNPLLHIGPSSNPFKQAVRTHPVDLVYSRLDNYNFEIEIPEGYSVEHIPPAYTVSNQIMNAAYLPSVEGNLILLKAGYAMRSRYEAEEYGELKSLYDDMLRAFSETIILKRD